MESSNVQVTDLPPNTSPSSYGLYASSARANTFLNHPSGQTWSDECPSSETMGKFGFHFTPSGRFKDRVTCFYCQVSQTGWKGITDPSEHHLKKNRSCYFAKIYNFLNRRASGEVLDWRKMNGFNEPFCGEAMQARLSTFHDLWPHDHREGFKSTSRTMTESGFSFVPQSDNDDLVICIYCGITLEGWELTDDPIQEHKRRDEGGQCYFLKRYEELKASGADMPTLDNPLIVSVVAKSRGRPKSKLTSETTSHEINQTQDDQFKSSPSKKRGRPKKAANSEIPSSPTKRRGRPPKTASSPSKDTDDYEPPIRARRSPLRKPNHEEAEDSAHTAFTDLTASSVSRTRPRRNVKSPKKYTEYESDEDIPVKPVASKPAITDEQIAPKNSEDEEEEILQNNNSDESYGLTSHSIELASESKPYQPLLKRYGSKARTSKITKSSNSSSSMVRNNNRSQTLSMSPIKKSKLLDSSFDNEGMFSTNNLRGVEIGAGLARMGSILKDLSTESRTGSGDGVNENVTSVTLKEKTQEEPAKEDEEEGVEQEEEGEVTLIANDITESPLKSSKGITAVSDENESSQEGALGATNETPKPTEVIPDLELDVQDDQQEEQEEEEEAEKEEEEIPIEVEQEVIETETEPQAEGRDEYVNEEPELPLTEQELLNDDGSSEDERDQEEQQQEQEEEQEQEHEEEQEDQKYIEITSGNSDYQDSVMYQPQMEEMRVEEVSEAQGDYEELVVGDEEAQESREQQTASPGKNDDQIDEGGDSNDTVIRYKVGNRIDKIPTQPVSIEGSSVIEIKPHRMPMSSTPVKQPLADITDKESSKHSNTEARDEEEEEEIENTTNNNTGFRPYFQHPRVSNKENQFNSRKRNINDDFDGNSSPESSLIQSSPTLNKVKRSKILNSKISHGSIHETFNNSSLSTQVLDPMKSSLKGYRQHSRTNSNSNSNLNLSALNNKSAVSISSSSSATLVNLLDNGAARLAQRPQSRFVNNDNIPATGKKEKSTLIQSHTIASQPINSHNSSKFNSELPVIADDLPIGESTENNIIVTTTTATTVPKQPQKSPNEPVKWHPTNIDTIFENLQDLELAKNYLMTLSELGYDLDDDIDGRITNFINQMPTEELNMTLEQWIEHIAEEGALHFNEIANLMIENFQMESDRALTVLEALPTVD